MTEKSYVIKDHAALDALLAAHDAAVDEQGRTYSPGYVAPKRLGLSPAVDFSRQTVFALARDDSPIRSIRQVGGQLRVEYLSKHGSSDNVDVATPAPRFWALEIVVTNLRGDEVRDVSFVDVNSSALKNQVSPDRPDRSADVLTISPVRAATGRQATRRSDAKEPAGG